MARSRSEGEVGELLLLFNQVGTMLVAHDLLEQVCVVGKRSWLLAGFDFMPLFTPSFIFAHMHVQKYCYKCAE